MEPTKAAGKLLLKRPTGETATLILTYPKLQAERMRATVASIRFDGRKTPMSLLAKRSLDTYLDALDMARTGDPARYAGEMAALRRLLTPIPQPAKRRKSVAR